MYKFSKTSKKNLSEAHPKLQELFNEVINHWDCSVICGHRTKEAQMGAYTRGDSQVMWPDSRHNSKPSMAVDVTPYPLNWLDSGSFYMFAGFVKAIAYMLDIKVRYGGDWDGDKKTTDQTFHDLAHWELIED